VVSKAKLIAEPWDAGEGGYQVGNFPVLWSEWNGRYRDTMRDFWRGARTGVADVAYRLTGSSDLYQADGRRPWASINFVTAHDGFTLHDLVSYDDKHNEANGEGNRDGGSDNRSWNCGVEGPTEDSEVSFLRERQRRNFLTSLLLSQGVPMLLAGDELGRTQLGNNNAYCQDNEISWVDWELDEERVALLDFVSAIVALRREHPVFRRRTFFQGQAVHGAVKDIGWFTPDGTEMDEAEWQAPDVSTLGVFLNGEEIPDQDRRGERIVDASFMLLLNGGGEPALFKLPGEPWAKEYELLADTALAFVRPPGADAPSYMAGEELSMASRSLAVLRKRT
jgi:glycogen operon protein